VVKDSALKRYIAHASHVTSVRFLRSSNMVISTGGKDACVVQWRVHRSAGSNESPSNGRLHQGILTPDKPTSSDSVVGAFTRAGHAPPSMDLSSETGNQLHALHSMESLNEEIDAELESIKLQARSVS
jgi:hypothetical protein